MILSGNVVKCKTLLTFFQMNNTALPSAEKLPERGNGHGWRVYLRSELLSERCRIWLTGLPAANEIAEDFARKGTEWLASLPAAEEFAEAGGER